MLKPVSIIKRVLPPSWQTVLRQSSLWTNWQSRSLAGGAKRLDLCSVELARHLQLAGIDSLEGQICLELGSGWLLTHALAMHLLGAKRVFATDIAALARPQSLKTAVRKAHASVVRDHLASFTPHAAVRARMNRLAAIRHFSFDVLQDLGIEYVAPVDLARQAFEHRVGFIYSVSVLEHVTQPDLAPLLRHLADSLQNGGHMLHAIHLEDHRDFLRRPFDFYTEASEGYRPFDQCIRGNRVRYSQWMSLFHDLPGTESRVVFRFQREDVPLPTIDASIQHTGEEDLRTSHLGVVTRKLRTQQD